MRMEIMSYCILLLRSLRTSCPSFSTCSRVQKTNLLLAVCILTLQITGVIGLRRFNEYKMWKCCTCQIIPMFQTQMAVSNGCCHLCQISHRTVLRCFLGFTQLFTKTYLLCIASRKKWRVNNGVQSTKFDNFLPLGLHKESR